MDDPSVSEGSRAKLSLGCAASVQRMEALRRDGWQPRRVFATTVECGRPIDTQRGWLKSGEHQHVEQRNARTPAKNSSHFRHLEPARRAVTPDRPTKGGGVSSIGAHGA